MNTLNLDKNTSACVVKTNFLSKVSPISQLDRISTYSDNLFAQIYICS